MNDFEVHPIGTAQRLSELERDAARYRWLRVEACQRYPQMTIGIWGINGNPHAGFDARSAEQIDRAIDAAMGEAK